MNSIARIFLRRPSTFLPPCLFLCLLFQVIAPAQVPSAATADDSREEKIRVNTNVISLRVSVTDARGKFIPSLEQAAFHVYEDKIPQEISYFSAQDTPASICVVFDLSGSMTGEKVMRAREALRRFIQTSHQDDEYSLVGFNQQAEVLLENTCDSDRLLSRLTGLRPKGDTALYDAVMLGLAQLAHGKWTKRALIVLSDGEDNSSRATFRQIRRAVQEADVTIYGVLIQDMLMTRFGASVMQDLALVSGGQAYTPDNPEQMSEIFEKIALELRQQYSIGYTPTSFVADGKWRKLKVLVTLPPETVYAGGRVIVGARQGYFAVPEKSGSGDQTAN
ncbi:MAG: VWA domain-containing protein [Blastocatellia bacterium]